MLATLKNDLLKVPPPPPPPPARLPPCSMHDVLLVPSQLTGSADARLCVLQDPERQKEVADLLGMVESEEFAHLVALGKMMVDFTSASDAPDAAAAAAAATAGTALDEDIGVAVEFEDEDEDEEGEEEGAEVLVSTCCPEVTSSWLRIVGMRPASLQGPG